MSYFINGKNGFKYEPFSCKVFSFLIVMMMIGSVYLFPIYKSLDMGEVLLILFLPYFLIKLDSFSISKQFKYMYIFAMYSIFITIIMCCVLHGDIESPMLRVIRDSFYFFIIFFLGYHFFEMTSFKRMLVYFCVVLSGFIILQVIIYTMTGYLIPGFILNAPLNDGGYTGEQLYSHYIQYARAAGYLKPNGFLCEPAHCAQCFFVAILVLLFDEDRRKNDIKVAIFVSVGAIFTMSTSAILYVVFAWVLWCFKEVKKHFLKVSLIVFVTVLLGLYALKNGYLDSIIIVIQRFTKTISGDVITNSSQLRMMKGFLTFFSLPLLEKLLGIGFGNYSAAVSSILRYANINMIENEYMNTIAYILVSTGIVGFLLMLFFFISIYKRNHGIGKIMVIALLIMSLGTSIYSSPIWVWMMLLILYSGRRNKKNNGRCINS